MKIVENYSLQPLNTFGFDVSARYFGQAETVEDLRQAIGFAGEKKLLLIPLGGGSNVVLSDHLEALVLAVDLKGRSVVSQQNDQMLVQCRAGENWHEFVLWTLDNEAYGLENLSLIPGNVGAAPIQNIGAYGVEIKDVFHSLEALDIATGELRTFDRDDCQFGYRDSVFKNSLKDRFIITSVTFELSSVLEPKLGYGHLQNAVQKKAAGQSLTAKMISDVVCEIRSQKLPDPAVIGNAGSFFKNPVVPASVVDRLKQEFPDLVCFPFEGEWKLAAGWLIDQAGLKGFTMGQVGTYAKQALVLVNHGEGTPRELVALADHIRSTVLARFGVELEMEPRVY
ncbi:UDP-N-acetylenolpyruvoylglucosamine reductase [Endozoicomonas sp. OPT23]|uniref:UDP-N-acetylmuramate dehydrogenase n=1 Tax=Endozoicomonas sp. OPT23 TaxID=2072845 RepID=UPI00129B337F|nr:UDP-N-acetylmuramate dehydrogenase [Endozoicomonas sp. OPT23]MRI35236.1 UDP-N-acetylenolpyruvoylglucosamine reductase [Endozoicomonas sp. OPT23]